MAIKSLQHSSITDNIFYRSMLAGNAAFDPGDEFLLEEQVLSSSAASVTFSGLSQYAGVYQHLQIRALVRTSTGSPSDSTYIRFNSDISNGSNYTLHYLQGNGSTVVSGSYPNSSGPYIIDNVANTATANVYSPVVVDILDPFSSTKNTTMRAFWWVGITGGYPLSLRSSAWLNTEALTSMKIAPISGSNFLTGSRFSLYGVK